MRGPEAAHTPSPGASRPCSGYPPPPGCPRLFLGHTLFGARPHPSFGYPLSSACTHLFIEGPLCVACRRPSLGHPLSTGCPARLPGICRSPTANLADAPRSRRTVLRHPASAPRRGREGVEPTASAPPGAGRTPPRLRTVVTRPEPGRGHKKSPRPRSEGGAKVKNIQQLRIPQSSPT